MCVEGRQSTYSITPTLSYEQITPQTDVSRTLSKGHHYLIQIQPVPAWMVFASDTHQSQKTTVCFFFASFHGKLLSEQQRMSLLFLGHSIYVFNK